MTNMWGLSLRESWTLILSSYPYHLVFSCNKIDVLVLITEEMNYFQIRIRHHNMGKGVPFHQFPKNLCHIELISSLPSHKSFDLVKSNDY